MKFLTQFDPALGVCQDRGSVIFDDVDQIDDGHGNKSMVTKGKFDMTARANSFLATCDLKLICENIQRAYGCSVFRMEVPPPELMRNGNPIFADVHDCPNNMADWYQMQSDAGKILEDLERKAKIAKSEQTAQKKPVSDQSIGADPAAPVGNNNKGGKV